MFKQVSSTKLVHFVEVQYKYYVVMYEQVTEHDIYKVGFLMVLSRRVANTGQAELCLVLAHILVEFRLAFVAQHLVEGH